MREVHKPKRVTVRFPAALQARLERRAKLSGKTESEVVREAVEAHVSENVRPKSALQLAKQLELVGCVKDAPADLSANPKYFEDFGKSR
jgi:predicted DNA-binding protein